MEKRYRLFLWQWCGACCGPYIVCPECGVNTCSGSFGNEQTCTTCNLAYQYAHLGYVTGKCPQTKKEVAKYNREIIKKEGSPKLEINTLYQGDCLELMKNIAEKSVDMVLADLP